MKELDLQHEFITEKIKIIKNDYDVKVTLKIGTFQSTFITKHEAKSKMACVLEAFQKHFKIKKALKFIFRNKFKNFYC